MVENLVRSAVTLVPSFLPFFILKLEYLFEQYSVNFTYAEKGAGSINRMFMNTYNTGDRCDFPAKQTRSVTLKIQPKADKPTAHLVQAGDDIYSMVEKLQHQLVNY